MSTILNTLIPVLLIMPLGYLLKRVGLFKTDDTKILNKIILNVLLPAIVFSAFLQLELKKELLLLPLSGFIIILSLFFISIIIGRTFSWERRLKGSFTMLFASMEGGLIAYPLFLILFKEEGLATIALWDIANTIVVFTLLYFWACKCGGSRKGQAKDAFKKVVTCPIPIAMVLGLMFNTLHINLDFLNSIISYLGNATPAIIMLTLGIAMEPSLKTMKLPLITIISKTIIGGLLGLLVSSLFHFTGLWRLVTIVAATLPAPAVMYVFASEQKLDKRFVANYLSLALPIGVIVASIILMFL
ncbi:MAG: AEC family transporter [Nanoarchaeota archaeon]